MSGDYSKRCERVDARYREVLATFRKAFGAGDPLEQAASLAESIMTSRNRCKFLAHCHMVAPDIGIQAVRQVAWTSAAAAPRLPTLTRKRLPRLPTTSGGLIAPGIARGPSNLPTSTTGVHNVHMA